jgi:hypothetical protein
MYRDFSRWLFDGSHISKIPNEQEILKYNSPINHQYVLQCLLPHERLTRYLNTYFNNYDLFQIPKKEFFIFIKSLVLELNINLTSFNFKKSRNYEKNELYNKLLKKLPELKNYDVALLADIIDKLEENEKESYYSSLGLSVPKKRKLAKKTKKETIKKIKFEDYFMRFYNFI